METVDLNVINVGVGPYTYLWHDGSIDPANSISSDFFGEVCVTVTDAQDCISDACITFDPLDPCFVFISEEDGYNSVTLTASAYGQSQEIDYEWSTGENEIQIQVTESGEYCVTISDENDCVAIDCLNVLIDSSAWDDCFAYIYIHNSEGTGTDELLVDAFGQTPFDFTWKYNGQFISGAESIQPTEEGLYCAEVMDATGCIFNTCIEYSFTPDCSVFIGYNHSDETGELLQ